MNQKQSWIAISLLTILSILFYVLMEWLFFVTKPSFLSTLDVGQRIGVLATSPLVPILLGTLGLLLFRLLSSFSQNPAYRKFWATIAKSIAAFVLASSILLLIDNFTITTFEFGIRSSHGIGRVGYGVLFCIFFLVCYRSLMVRERKMISERGAALSTVFRLFIGILIVGSLLTYAIVGDVSARSIQHGLTSGKFPNILLIGSDGVNADNMSVYGYQRDTTPFIRGFAKSALVSAYCFSNASRTLGSIVSILTGKLPTQTRLICPPDILRGEDAYQHLPGLLRNYGYSSLQLTVRNYADAYDANMRSAFDFVNFRSSDEQLALEMVSRFVGQESAYFLQQMYDRLSERLLHAFGMRDMLDPFAEVMHRKKETYPDSRKMEELFSFIKSSDRPFFAHIHFMGTHRTRVKGRDQAGSELLNMEFYDEEIAEFDRNFKRAIDFLAKSNRLENTIVVLYSDHGYKHATKTRVPLIIRFPGGKYKGQASGVVENVDIAPTLLDYLHIPKPAWMSGRSLLSSQPDDSRWVVSVWPIKTIDQQQKMKIRAEARGPFYTLGAVSVISCGRYFKLDLESRKAEDSEVPAFPNPQNCKVPGRNEAMRFILQHLRQNHYDTSSLLSRKS